MSIANHFYHETTKKYIAIFGSIFNKLTIERKDNENDVVQSMIVPISYGPYQKFLARIQQDPNLDRKTAITLPRMSFEITNWEYDSSRKIPSTNRMVNMSANNENYSYSPAPYNLSFSLYLMAKNAEDGVQILEQVIPFFKPEWTESIKLLDNLDAFDIPISLNGISTEDLYESDFISRRSLLWTLNFTMKCWYFGPIKRRSVIKLIDVRIFDKEPGADENILDTITIQPGLTSAGNPTDNINNTIPYEQINLGDDWGIITIIKESIE